MKKDKKRDQKAQSKENDGYEFKISFDFEKYAVNQK